MCTTVPHDLTYCLLLPLLRGTENEDRDQNVGNVRNRGDTPFRFFKFFSFGLGQSAARLQSARLGSAPPHKTVRPVYLSDDPDPDQDQDHIAGIMPAGPPAASLYIIPHRDRVKRMWYWAGRSWPSIPCHAACGRSAKWVWGFEILRNSGNSNRVRRWFSLAWANRPQSTLTH